VGAETVKNNSAGDKDYYGNSPIIDAVERVFPKPDLVNETVTIPLYYIVNGIQFNE
jgi:hypothetical protein